MTHASAESKRLRILLLAPQYDRQTPGESWSTYKWVEGISSHFETTVLTIHPKGWNAVGSPTSAAEIINWDQPTFSYLPARLRWELNPAYITFYRRARAWMKREFARGRRFDLVHQINPLALRYPCPARGLGVPFIIGPLAGSLPTPPGFQDPNASKAWYRKLRNLDRLRLRYDPLLRGSYRKASLLLGVAPYVGELLATVGIGRFEIASETGVEAIVEQPKAFWGSARPMRLLFVGRLIATKGIEQAIRAAAQAQRIVPLQFDVLGDGDLRARCAALVRELGAESFIKLHGKVTRSEVSTWYRSSDVFLFPSYREPSGNVVMEALGSALPIITTDVGGPGFVVDDSCGIRVTPRATSQFVDSLTQAILELAQNPTVYQRLSQGALHRVRSIAYWPEKVARLAQLYRETVGDQVPKA